MSDHSSPIVNILKNLHNFGKIYAQEKKEIYLNDYSDYKITDEDAIAYINQQSGFSRVKEMFFSDHNLRMSPQMELATNTMIQTGFTFAIISSIFGAQFAREKFLLKAQHRSFTTKFIANRGFNDASIFGALRFGLKFGFKAGIFSGIFMVTSQTVSVYRNKTGILEHVLAGGLTCGILRINGGPKAFIGAGTIGLFLGLIGGIFLKTILNGFGYNQEKINFETVKEKFSFTKPHID